MSNFKKITLEINGADRTFICDYENDSLADVLRRLGLTGTKIGCKKGLCGACSVIMDGKVIRSCVTKMKTIKEYQKVTTIEGIGTALNPHPLQYAWVHLGAVQCGFCVPGFIVSAYQLLKENDDPTREEVREWFFKHKNVCRCTGYIQIVDAVMAAAAILRGEKTLKDITYDYKKDTKNGYYGKPLIRPNAMAKAVGVCDYGDDVELKMPETTLHVALVMPRVAHHAKILKINTEEASKMEGVVKVITAKDALDAGCTNKLMTFQFSPRTEEFPQVHKLLQDEKIVSYGSVVAMVAARSKKEAVAAAEKVTVDIEQLPEYLNYLDACKDDSIRVQPEMSNVFSKQPLRKGDADNVPKLIDDAKLSVEGSFYSTREPHLSIEGDTAQAYYDEDNKLCIHCKTMTLYFDLEDVATAVGEDMENMRMIENPTGGSFGWAMSAGSYALTAMACKVLKKPVALSMDYSQFMAFSGKRSPAYFNARLACDSSGKIVAGEFDSGLDHGCFPELGDDKLTKILRFMFFPYNVPNCLGLTRVSLTNHAFGTAYRGYGAPQAYTCGEALVDMLAQKAGIDPFEFRYKNIARKGDLNLNQVEFLQYPMTEMMDLMKPKYEAAKKTAEKFNASSDGKIKKGIGLAWGGYNVGLGGIDVADVAIELTKDNKFIKYDTWQDQGQGGDAGSLIVTLEALREYFPDITPDDVKLVQDDSKYCPNTGESAGSRSHFANGKASILAAKNIADAMRKDDGTYRTYDEMVSENIPLRYEGNWIAGEEWEQFGDLDPNTGKGDPTYAYTYALYLAEVSVDTTSGKTTVDKITCVYDIGKPGNIQSVTGQINGGISHAIGFALQENYDDVKKHNNMFAAGVPYITDIPDNIESINHDSYDERGPFGSSGASEAFQSSDHVAVINAINNAVGVRIYELPATPEKVKAGIDAINSGQTPFKPEKYDLGSDFYKEMEELKNNPL